MKFILTSVTIRQICHACDYVGRTERHHMGCERMWLRHFAKRCRSKRYKAFKARYESFHPQDIRPLCETCHIKIHRVYLRVIRVWMERDYRKRLNKKRPARPLSDWSWEEAEELISALRQRGHRWIDAQRKTNGLKPL